jgi:hypothetical protein
VLERIFRKQAVQLLSIIRIEPPIVNRPGRDESGETEAGWAQGKIIPDQRESVQERAGSTFVPKTSWIRAS